MEHHQTTTKQKNDQDIPRQLFLHFLGVFLIPSFSAAKVQQLWEMDPSCQHFNVIKERVNQSAAQVPQKWNPGACYFSPGRALCPGINSHCGAGFPPGPRWPAHLIFVVSNKQHESSGSWKTTCSRSLWMLSLLAGNTCVATTVWFLWFSKYSWTQRERVCTGREGSRRFWPLNVVSDAMWDLLVTQEDKKMPILFILELIFAPMK